jgi:hypothetical protein
VTIAGKAETYEGSACYVCGGTTRHVSGRTCVHYNDNVHLAARGALERKQAWHRDYTRAYQPQWTAERREQGLCYACDAPARAGRAYCARHGSGYSQRGTEWRRSQRESA